MEWLHVNKDKIVDASGEEVYLRGTCVGGWMNMEDFINAYPGTESGLKHHMAQTLGASRAQLFFDCMADQFFNEEDAAFIASSGANCVRLPLNYRHFERDDNPFHYLEQGFRRLDRAVEACGKAGLYVILDMHSAPGWQNSHWHSDNERGAALFWTHRQFQDRLAGLWKALAQHYRDCPAVAGYNLLNEPNTGNPRGEHVFDFYENHRPDWDVINQVYRRLAREIREVDNRHILFLEGDFYSRKFEGLEPPFAENLVYSSHNYIPPGFGPGKYPGHYDSGSGPAYWDKNAQRREFRNHEGTIFTRKHQVPLWVGEFGSQYHGPAEELSYRYASMEDQLSIYNENRVHWTTWTYKDAGVMGWVSLDPESEYMQLVAPVQAMKKNLGAENFVAAYGWRSRGRELSRNLADYIVDEAGIQSWRKEANAFVMNYAVLTGFAAASLQPAYALRFKGMNEDEIERVASAFHIRNCIKNETYMELLGQKTREGR